MTPRPRSALLALALLSSAAPAPAQLDPAFVTVNELCDGIRGADPFTLAGVKDDLKSWMLESVDLANEIIQLEDALDRVRFDIQDQADAYDLAESELERLLDEQITREDKEIARHVETLQTQLKLLDQANQRLRTQRALLDGAASQFQYADAKISEIQEKIDRIDRGDYTDLSMPAEHLRRSFVMDMNVWEQKREAAASEAGRAYALSPSDWPRDQGALTALREGGDREWEAYQAKRNSLIWQISVFQKQQRGFADPQGAGRRVSTYSYRYGADRMSKQMSDLRMAVKLAESTERALPGMRRKLSANQAAFRELWHCLKQREQELAGGAGATTTPVEAPRWTIDGSWRIACDDEFVTGANGGFRATIGESGETFGRFWEVDGAEGTITGRVVGGRVDWQLHYESDPMAVSGSVALGPGGRASGGGEVVTGELSTMGRCAGTWSGR